MQDMNPISTPEHIVSFPEIPETTKPELLPGLLNESLSSPEARISREVSIVRLSEALQQDDWRAIEAFKEYTGLRIQFGHKEGRPNTSVDRYDEDSNTLYIISKNLGSNEVMGGGRLAPTAPSAVAESISYQVWSRYSNDLRLQDVRDRLETVANTSHLYEFNGLVLGSAIATEKPTPASARAAVETILEILGGGIAAAPEADYWFFTTIPQIGGLMRVAGIEHETLFEGSIVEDSSRLFTMNLIDVHQAYNNMRPRSQDFVSRGILQAQRSLG